MVQKYEAFLKSRAKKQRAAADYIGATKKENMVVKKPKKPKMLDPGAVKVLWKSGLLEEATAVKKPKKRKVKKN